VLSLAILTDFGKLSFFRRAFSWAQLRANSCARQLRGFCFPGSSRTAQVPPIKHPLALGAAASRYWVPQENGAIKRRKFHVLPKLSDDHRIRRHRPGAASSAEQQRLEVHRSFRRDAAVVEEHRRAIKTNIADSLNVVVHVERRPGRRYISEVLFINRYDPDADLFDYGAVFLAKQDHQ
jgi:hypothetical protein